MFRKFVEEGLVKEEKIEFDQIYKVIEKAHRSIKSAHVLFGDNDLEGSYQLAYEAMLLAGRALVFSFDLRPRAAGSHKIVVDFVEEIFKDDSDNLVIKFNKMRKNRHYLIYGMGLAISEIEVKNAMESATKLVEKIEKIIAAKNPQKKLNL